MPHGFLVDPAHHQVDLVTSKKIEIMSSVVSHKVGRATMNFRKIRNSGSTLKFDHSKERPFHQDFKSVSKIAVSQMSQKLRKTHIFDLLGFLSEPFQSSFLKELCSRGTFV